MSAPDVVPPAPVDPTGLAGPTRGRARGPDWRRTSRGRYVPSRTPSSVRQRIAEQAARLGPDGMVTGWAALHLLGGERWFDGRDATGGPRPVDLVSPDRQLVDGAQARVRRSSAPASDRLRVGGIPCATAERALFDLTARGPLDDAVVAADLAFLSELTSQRRMATYLATRRGHRGLWLVQDALARSDERSWSPGETRLRLLWRRAPGLGAPRCNRPVFDLGGRLLGVPDLLDECSGLVAEYDGADHLHDRRRAQDLQRETLLRDHDLECLVFVAADLHHPERVLARLEQGQRRALDRRWQARRWTLSPPPWWIPPAHDVALDVRLARRPPRDRE